MTAFDFNGMLRVALAELKLSPSAFWAMTPYEFMTMTGRTPADMPMVRARFDALSRAFPDTKENDHDRGSE
jgi:uncharacterized phage protein (TIGR02216 family)